MSEAAISAVGLGKQYHLADVSGQRAHAALGQLVRRVLHPGTSQGLGESFWPVKDCSFSIYPGEMAAVIGRNGAGKSVLLKMLSRITKPTTGRALIRGKLISLLEVGSGFHPELSGRDNIFLNGAILGVRRSEMLKKFDEMVAFAGTGRFIDEPVKHYSSGMYMRLAFSVATHLEADVLLIDEVLAVGDETFRGKCIDRLRQARDRGAAILVVSHAMDTLMTLCSRGLFLQQGRLICDGDIQQAIRLYQEQD
jgi:lipopolysaccharide transport system ATP-binding protein